MRHAWLVWLHGLVCALLSAVGDAVVLHLVGVSVLTDARPLYLFILYSAIKSVAAYLAKSPLPPFWSE